MALTLMVLNAGQITLASPTVVDIYSPAISQQKNVLVKSIIFTNTDTASRTVDVSLAVGATDYSIYKATIGAGQQAVFTKELTLDLRDTTAKKIKASTGVANKIHYVITGLEKDV